LRGRKVCRIIHKILDPGRRREGETLVAGKQSRVIPKSWQAKGGTLPRGKRKGMETASLSWKGNIRLTRKTQLNIIWGSWKEISLQAEKKSVWGGGNPVALSKEGRNGSKWGGPQKKNP